MGTEADLICAVKDLSTRASNVVEEAQRVLLEGTSLDGDTAELLKITVNRALELEINPVLNIDNASVDPRDMVDITPGAIPWSLVIGKRRLAAEKPARNDEDTLLFFSVDGFQKWLKNIDPFTCHIQADALFTKPTTVRVHGLSEGFGGQSLWVLPLDALEPPIAKSNLPSFEVVHGFIHINTTDQAVRVCPSCFALTWGDLKAAVAAPLLKISASVLSSCLVQELKRIHQQYEVTLRGTKRISMPLSTPDQVVVPETIRALIEAVSWVYEDRPETRLQLIMDRLSIDSESGDTLLSTVEANLVSALQQARDSYAFVILERKDAYHKEMRELLKDMRSQADLYAAKVRELVNSLTRDILGVLVFVGFSFIGKFDHEHLAELLVSDELSLLVKFLAGYLLLSCLFQIVVHWRDASLGLKETECWLDILQNYTSKKDRKSKFSKIIGKRKTTLYIAMTVASFVYLVLIIATWNMPCIVGTLLAR